MNENSNPQEPETPQESGSSVNPGVVTLLVGLLIAVFPIILAAISTAPGSSIYNEGDPSSGAAALWLLLVSVPVGGLIAVVGLVWAITTSNKQKSSNYPVAPSFVPSNGSTSESGRNSQQTPESARKVGWLLLGIGTALFAFPWISGNFFGLFFSLGSISQPVGAFLAIYGFLQISRNPKNTP
ncbi:MAG: hypothetical protein RL038_531 [Actinomycetota bacterium]